MPISEFSETQFFDTYCVGEQRSYYGATVNSLFKYARQTHARDIYIGGSFINTKVTPNDIDVLLAYNLNQDIPNNVKYPGVSSIPVDIQYSSYEQEDLLDSFIFMFGHDRTGMPRELIRISLNGNTAPYQPHEPDPAKLKLVKEIYEYREQTKVTPYKGILVSVHGLYSKGEWNVDIAPIASSQGWIFAPYVYTGNNLGLLFLPWKRKKTIEHFRKWIYDICERYKELTPNLSIVAHSYGTYIVGKYLEGFDTNLPIDLNAIILKGSVLNRNYDWDKHFAAANIGSVLNIHSPNDSLIKFMPNTEFKKLIGVDPLFGSAGYRGFDSSHPRLMQKKLAF